MGNVGVCGKPVVLFSSCSLVFLKVPLWRDNVAASVKRFSFPGGTIRLFPQVLLLPLQQQQKSKRLRWWHSHLWGQGSIPCGVLLFMVRCIGLFNAKSKKFQRLEMGQLDFCDYKEVSPLKICLESPRNIWPPWEWVQLKARCTPIETFCWGIHAVL